MIDLYEGPSVGVENAEGDWTYGLVVTFPDATARDTYLTHPAHVPVGELILGHAAGAAGFDIAG